MIYHGAHNYREMDTFNDLRVTVAQAVEDLRDVDFDSIAVTGVSGMAVGFPLAAQLGKRIAVLRKDGEDNHSCEKWAGHAGLVGRTIIVDDFVAGGDTYRRLRTALDAFPGAYNEVVEYVGSYMYRDRLFTPAGGAPEGSFGFVLYGDEPDDDFDGDFDFPEFDYEPYEEYTEYTA